MNNDKLPWHIRLRLKFHVGRWQLNVNDIIVFELSERLPYEAMIHLREIIKKSLGNGIKAIICEHPLKFKGIIHRKGVKVD